MNTLPFAPSHILLATLFATGCTASGPSSAHVPAQPSPGVTEASTVMLRHFDHARSLSSSAVFGRVATAHDAAASMRGERAPVGAQSEARASYEVFLTSVAAVEQTTDRVALASAAADVAGRCGDCHLASGLGPSFDIGRIEDPRTPRDHLRVLAWGSSRMWESLVARSDLAWRAGARALSGQRLREELYAGRMADPSEGRRLGERLHELGVEALSTDGHAERVRLLGEVWGTCAQCHELVGVTE